MGQCNFYLKARFATAQQAAVALPRLIELLRQGEAAYLYWQNSRRGTHGSQEAWQPPDAETFWAGFRQRFPLVHRYLHDLADTPAWDNGLAGQLSCMIDPLDPRTIDPYASLVQEGNLLLLKLSGIWHYAEMGRLERYCLENLGAVAVGSISEEGLEWEKDKDEDDPKFPEDEVFFGVIDV